MGAIAKRPIAAVLAAAEKNLPCLLGGEGNGRELASLVRPVVRKIGVRTEFVTFKIEERGEVASHPQSPEFLRELPDVDILEHGNLYRDRVRRGQRD